MATLIVGLMVLVGAAVWASSASEGAWLAFLESPVQPEQSGVEAQKQKRCVRTLANTSETRSQVSRVASLPGLHQSKIEVVK